MRMYKEGEYSSCNRSGRYYCKDVYSGTTYIGGKFSSCPDPGAQYCLDQYSGDGSLEFQVQGL